MRVSGIFNHTENHPNEGLHNDSEQNRLRNVSRTETFSRTE